MKKKSYFALALALPLLISCNGGTIGPTDPVDGGTSDPPDLSACSGLQCYVNESACTPATHTKVTGTVYIPSGKFPLYNAKVYIPIDPDPASLPPVGTGIDPVNGSCDRCDPSGTTGVASAVTDLNGQFTLSHVPVGIAFPVVIKVGKWRRVVRVPPIAAACTTTTLPVDQTRLPRNKSEGNIPKIALTTGNADALECLLRSTKLGLDEAEFTNPTGDGRVNLYTGGPRPVNNVSTYGTDRYDLSLNGGATFPQASTWWSAMSSWKSYDIVLLSCEGLQNNNLKSSSDHEAMEDYIAKGGRVFASHFHNTWISNASTASKLSTVATFLPTGGFQDDSGNPILATINQTFAKGQSLAQWLVNANAPGTITLGQLPIKYSRITLTGRNAQLTTSWADYSDPMAMQNGVISPASQYFSFNAPVGAQPSQQCGQMVFTDMHVSGSNGPTGDASLGGTKAGGGLPFPTGCRSPGLSPQEQALMFMLFDLTNCITVPIG